MDESNSSNDKGNNGPGNNDNDPTQGNRMKRPSSSTEGHPGSAKANENQNVAEPTGDNSLSDDTWRVEAINNVRTTVSPVRRISFSSTQQTGSCSTIRSLLIGSKRPSSSTEGHPGPAKAPQPGPSSMSQPGPSSMPQPGPSSMSQPGPSSMSQPGPSSMPQPGPSSMSQPGPSQPSQEDQEGSPFDVRTESSYLKSGWSVETVEEREVDERGRNALHILCSQREYEEPYWMIRRLIKRKFNPNTPDKEGKTPLHLAVISENFRALKLLMKNGGNINVLNEDGWPPMFYLRRCEHMAHILKHNPDLNYRDKYGNNIFQFFCKFDPFKINPFFMLTKHNINFGNINNKGQNCLHILTRYNKFIYFVGQKDDPKIKLIKFLIQKGASVKQKNSRLETPLHLAVVYDTDFVSVFLHAGAALDVVDENNSTPFDIAIYEGGQALKEVIRYIVFRKHRRLPIKKKNMDLIDSMEDLKNIFEELEGPMEDLKNEKIVPSSPTTYYDIISSTKNELLQIVNNSGIEGMLGDVGERLSNNQYREEILMVIEEGIFLRDQQLAIDILTESLGRRLPYLCVERIVSFMSAEMIKELINSDGNPNQ